MAWAKRERRPILTREYGLLLYYQHRLCLHTKFRFPLCNYASRFKGYNLSLPSRASTPNMGFTSHNAARYALVRCIQRAKVYKVFQRIIR